MTNGDAAQGSARDDRSDLLDIRDKGVGANAKAGIDFLTLRRGPIEIFTTNGNTHNQFGEGVTVLGDGCLEGSQLVVHTTTRGPKTQQQGGVFSNGSGNGGNGRVGSTTLLRDSQYTDSASCLIITSLTIMVYNLALVKPEVPTRFLAVENSDSKSD